MAVTTVTTTMAGAINYTVVTDTSADWPSVANSTYFYDKADKLVHYKDSTGAIQEIFSAAGGSAITLTSAGGSQTLVNDGTGPSLAVKGLTAGGGILLTPSVGNDFISIVNTSPATGVTLTSAGGTETLVNDGTGPAIATKGVTAGTGISLSSTATDLTVTNTAPDQVVALTAGTGINITGTYPNFTIDNTDPATITGSGTTNYLARWTPSGTQLGVGVIRDDGTYVGVGTAPVTGTTGYKFYLRSTSEVSVGVYSVLPTSVSTTATTYAVAGFNQNSGSGDKFGTRGFANNGTGLNVGVEAIAQSPQPTATNIGIVSNASSGLSNYAAKLTDGTEGINKFLKSVTADGKTNWADITVADTGLTLTTTGTSGAATLVGDTLNIPQYADVNIYNSDGTLSGFRSLDLNAQGLAFQDITANGQFSVNIDDGATRGVGFVVNALTSSLNVYDNVTGEGGALVIDKNQARLEVVNPVGPVTRKIEATSAGIEVNGLYTFPNTDGSAFQALTTDGAGNLYWSEAITPSSAFIPPIEQSEIRRGGIAINNTTTVGTFGGLTSVITGSSVALLMSPSTITRLPKLRLLTSTGSTNSVVGILFGTQSAIHNLGFGFRFVGSYVFSDVSAGGTEWFVPNARQFIGLTEFTGTLMPISSTVTVESQVNIIGMGSDAADTNLQIFHNDGTGTATKINLGSNFPANKTGAVANGVAYQLELYALFNATSVKYRVTRLSDGLQTTGTISSNLPANNRLLCPQVVRTSGATSQNVSIDFIQLTAYTLN